MEHPLGARFEKHVRAPARVGVAVLKHREQRRDRANSRAGSLEQDPGRGPLGGVSDLPGTMRQKLRQYRQGGRTARVGQCARGGELDAMTRVFHETEEGARNASIAAPSERFGRRRSNGRFSIMESLDQEGSNPARCDVAF